MYLDVKYSVWERLYLNEDATESNIISILENNQKDVKLGLIPDKIHEMIAESNVLLETETVLPADENATVELYNDEHKLIWNNT